MSETSNKQVLSIDSSHISSEVVGSYPDMSDSNRIHFYRVSRFMYPEKVNPNDHDTIELTEQPVAELEPEGQRIICISGFIQEVKPKEVGFSKLFELYVGNSKFSTHGFIYGPGPLQNDPLKYQVIFSASNPCSVYIGGVLNVCYSGVPVS